MASIPLTDLLSSRKWDQALFTTYALSLTFFETCVLRELRQQKCRQIYVITDVDGYQSSLSERRSTRVGHEYRVIPVALPHGVFHPKCTYLSGPDGDVLAVGSGNITFGGYGRNLEVFEILDPKSAPEAFADFADFLEGLAKRDDIILPDKIWIQQFTSLARRQSINTLPEALPQPRLLHSVVSPIIDQIEELVFGQDISTVTVLSPFHDTDGRAVHQLAKRIGASKVKVALPTRHASETTFPFHAAKSWGIDLSAVTPNAESPNRCLHAKWFQIDSSDSDTVTVTGSINATSKALCTIDNIEVGVLRRHSPGLEWVTWEKSDIPKETTVPSYYSSGLGSKCIVHAVLRSDGSLTGWLIASSDVAGNWEGFLECGTGEQCGVSITANDDGRFTSSVTAPDRLLLATGLQIVLMKEDRRARGWVNQEDILKLGREQRTIIRFLNDEDTIDDEIALLDYLALSVNRHAHQFGGRIKITKKPNDEGQDKKSESLTIHISDIAPLLVGDGEFTENRDLDKHSGEFDLFSRLRRYLLGERYSSQKEPKADGIDISDEGDESEQKAELAKRKTIGSRLESFEGCIRQCLDETHDAARRRAALVYWFEVKLHIMKRHDWRDDGLVFVKIWFWRACSEKLLVSPFEALEQHLFTAAAVCALMLPNDENRYQGMVMLHEALERFSGGEVDRNLALDVLLDHSDVGFASFLVPSQEDGLADALKSVLQTTTLRAQLETELQRYEDGKPVNGELIIFKSAIGQQFYDVIKRRPGLKCYRTVRSSVLACPFCFTVLTVQEANNLKYHRIAQCTNCSRYAVNVMP